MQLCIDVDSSSLEELRALGLGDQRSPEGIAALLLRHALGECKTIRDLRRIVDALPSVAPAMPGAVVPRFRGGVIACLMHLLSEAKEKGQPRSAEELLADLQSMCGDASMYTVRAQLSRLPKEKNFPIRKFVNGKEKKYAAE